MNETEAIKTALIKETSDRFIHTVMNYDEWLKQENGTKFAPQELIAASLAVIASLMIDDKLEFIHPNYFGVN